MRKEIEHMLRAAALDTSRNRLLALTRRLADDGVPSTPGRTWPDPRLSCIPDRTHGRKLALFLDVRLSWAMPLPHTGEGRPMTLSGIVRVIALAAALGAGVPTVPDAAAAASARPGVTVPPVLGKFCGRFKVWGPRWAIFAAAVPCSVAVGIVRNHADEPVPPKRAPYPPLALHARWPVACVGGPDAGSLPASLVCGKKGTNMRVSGFKGV